MKISVTRNTLERKLVAVIAVEGRGVFLRCITGELAYLSDTGYVHVVGRGRNLGEAAKVSGRTPVYEGDTVTLQF